MRFFFKILLTLLTCVLLPCILVLLATNYAFTNLYQEAISNSRTDRLRAVSNTNSIIIDTIEESALRFTLNSNIQALGGYTKLSDIMSDNTYPMLLTRTLTLVQEQVNISDLIDSFYFYVADADYAVTSRNGVVKLENFSDTAWLEKYEELRIDRSAGRMMPTHTVYAPSVASVSFSNYGRRCITYVYPVTRYTTVFNGALVINLYEDKLLELYTADSADSNIAIFDKTGVLIAGAGMHDYVSILNSYGMEKIFSEQAPANGYFFLTVAGERQLCTWYKSDNRDLVLLSVDNMSTLMERQLSFQFMLFIFILALIPIASLLALLVSRRLYSPINKLVKELQNNDRLDLSGEKDELSAISRSINNLLREDYRIFSDSSREKLREAAFLRVLAGGGDAEDAKSIVPYSHNICILAAPENHSNKENDKIYNTRMRLLVRVLQDELSGNGMLAAVLRYEGDMAVAILSADGAVEDLKPLIEEKIRRAQGAEVMGCSVTYSVGSLTDDLAGVRQSFDEAKAALSYRFIKGLDCVLFYDDVYHAVEYLDATEQIQTICRYLESGRKEEMLEGINSLIDEISSHNNISFVNVTQILNQLLSGLMQYITENGIHLEEIMKENTVIYRSLWRNRTINEAGEWLRSIFSSIIDYQNAAENAGSEHVKRTLDYVRENFANDITIDSIAAQIGISYSYLRKIFKDATGNNLADYINELRMQKAKQLLISTNYTVKEIAAMCGYNHERSFSRSFVQAEGIPPGKYKLQHKAENWEKEKPAAL